MLISITNRCNEGCKHCFVNAIPNGVDSTIEQIEKVCKYIEIVMPPVVIISGGEITLSDNWFEKCKMIIDTVNRFKLGAVVLESNGCFMWDGRYDEVVPKLKQLLDSPVVANMQISSHKQYYPNYDKLMLAKSKLQKISQKINVVCNWQGVSTKLVRLGRAKNLITPNEVNGMPGCSPMASRILQVDELYPNFDYHDFLMWMFCSGYHCKPTIYVPTGKLVFGETQFCKEQDNIYRYDYTDTYKTKQDIETWYKNKKMSYVYCNACNACKNLPEKLWTNTNSTFLDFSESTSTSNL